MRARCEVIIDLKPDTCCGKDATGESHGIPVCADHEEGSNLVVFQPPPGRPPVAARPRPYAEESLQE